MHIGSLRTALFAYFAAKQTGGTFILRIEDTDKAREVAGSIAHIEASLRWLGIEWDYGPDKPGPFGSCIQSERLPIYRRYAESLLEKGLAYPDPYTSEELDAFRSQASDRGEPFLYRHHRPETFTAWDGHAPLRLKVPEVKRSRWHDAVRGELEAGEEMLDDIIILKGDGFPTYNFAHIVDDHEMGVTHILRGDEFISSMPKFLSIYDALGIAYPTFVSLPPILRDDRSKKLGKRDGAKDILEYRSEGYLPEAMVNFLALIGWNPGTNEEIFTMEELIARFSIAKIQRGGGAFNQEKLAWMQTQHMARLPIDAQVAYVTEALAPHVSALPQYEAARLARLTPTVLERVSLRTAMLAAAEAGEYDWAFATPTYEPSLLQWKQDPDLSFVGQRLAKVAELLDDASFTSPESIKEALWPFAEAEGRGGVLWPTRVALSGRAQSPDPFTCAYVLGKEETVARIHNAIARAS
jgi:glutamyl-tRNA synthetase